VEVEGDVAGLQQPEPVGWAAFAEQPAARRPHDGAGVYGQALLPMGGHIGQEGVGGDVVEDGH
jgi:hypothetical protein